MRVGATSSEPPCPPRRGGGEARAGGRGRSRTHPAPSPRKDPLLASAGQVFWLGDHPRPVPSRPEGQWLRPGSSPLTAAGQRGLRTPFPNPSDVESRSSARVRALSRCLALPRGLTLPRRRRGGGRSLRRAARGRRVALDTPAGGLEAPDEQRERVRRAEDALHGACRRALDRPRGARARAAAPWRLARRHPPPIAEGGRGSPA